MPPFALVWCLLLWVRSSATKIIKLMRKGMELIRLQFFLFFVEYVQYLVTQFCFILCTVHKHIKINSIHSVCPDTNLRACNFHLRFNDGQGQRMCLTEELKGPPLRRNGPEQKTCRLNVCTFGVVASAAAEHTAGQDFVQTSCSDGLNKLGYLSTCHCTWGRGQLKHFYSGTSSHFFLALFFLGLSDDLFSQHMTCFGVWIVWRTIFQFLN